MWLCDNTLQNVGAKLLQSKTQAWKWNCYSIGVLHPNSIFSLKSGHFLTCQWRKNINNPSKGNIWPEAEKNLSFSERNCLHLVFHDRTTFFCLQVKNSVRELGKVGGGFKGSDQWNAFWWVRPSIKQNHGSPSSHFGASQRPPKKDPKGFFSLKARTWKSINNLLNKNFSKV